MTGETLDPERFALAVKVANETTTKMMHSNPMLLMEGVTKAVIRSFFDIPEDQPLNPQALAAAERAVREKTEKLMVTQPPGMTAQITEACLVAYRDNLP